MRTFATLLVCASIGAFEAGCGSAANETEGEPIDRLERDFGGPDVLMVYLEASDEATRRATLAAYGMGYQVHPTLPSDVEAAEAINACPQFFPSSDRNTWHAFDGENYYIDGSGRPSRAYKNLPPIASAPRVTTCQTNVGQWGDAENPSNDYDGGHMIGSQLGGWGGRANLVPQDANFNRGNWVQLENQMADCRNLPSGRIRYYISVGYSNSTKLVPNTFGMQLTNQSSGSSISLSFTNVDYGGSSGTAERQRGVAFLESQGCP